MPTTVKTSGHLDTEIIDRLGDALDEAVELIRGDEEDKATVGLTLTVERDKDDPRHISISSTLKSGRASKSQWAARSKRVIEAGEQPSLDLSGEPDDDDEDVEL